MTGAGDPYKVLQVDPEAEDEVIQAAYRRLARKYHPDVTAGADAVARMIAINSAWDVLRDPARRAAHDLARASANRPLQPSPPRPEPHAPQAPHPRQPLRTETVSTDWTSGRSSHGGGYDPARMGAPDGLGAAGPAPGNPHGTVLTFGRFAGWSLGEIARTSIDYIEWLDRMPIGRPYRDEIDALLRTAGRRASAATGAQERRGLFRRR